MQPILKHIPHLRFRPKNDTQDIRIQMAPIYIRKLPAKDTHNSFLIVVIAAICCSIGFLLCSLIEGRGLRANN